MPRLTFERKEAGATSAAVQREHKHPTEEGRKRELRANKIFGGIGALLMFIAPFVWFEMPAFFWPVEVFGIILVLVALKGLANHYSAGGIFNNAFCAIILVVVGVIIGATLVWKSFIQIAGTPWSPISTWNWAGLTPFLTAALSALVVFFVFAIITGFLARRTLSLLSKVSNVDLFGLTGLMFLIGAFLTIIFVGFLLMWMSLLFLAIAFFSIREQTNIKGDAVAKAIGVLNETRSSSRESRCSDCGCTSDNCGCTCQSDYAPCQRDCGATCQIDCGCTCIRDCGCTENCGCTCTCVIASSCSCNYDCGCTSTCGCTYTCSDCGCTSTCGCTYTCSDCGCTSTCGCTFTCAPN
jgi:uncharacterized membrane protein